MNPPPWAHGGPGVATPCLRYVLSMLSPRRSERGGRRSPEGRTPSLNGRLVLPSSYALVMLRPNT